MTFPGGKTLTVVRRARNGEDAYGNDTFTETSEDVTNCAIWATGGGAGSRGGVVKEQESVQGRDAIIRGRIAIVPPGTNVDAIDRVIIDGLSYEVDGEPEDWESPFTGAHPGVQLTLRRVEG